MSVDKKALKWLEVPLNRFNEAAVPYHLDVLSKHRVNIQKFERLGQWEAAHKEHINAGRGVQQLRALIFEIDGLRSQVRDEDLEEFAKKTEKSRLSIQKSIQAYLDMSKSPPTRASHSPVNEWPEDGPLAEAELPPLQVQANLAAEEEELAKKEAYLRSWQQLQTDFQDLNHIFRDFSQMVHGQAELVDQIEDNVETAAVNVEEGSRILAKAAKMKAATYPMMGALLGGCMAGPIGMVAGLKLGALAGISGGLLGFTGGRFLKNKDEDPVVENSESPIVIQDNTVAICPPTALGVIS